MNMIENLKKQLNNDNSMKDLDASVIDGINQIKSYCKLDDKKVGDALTAKEQYQKILLPLQVHNVEAYARIEEAEKYVFGRGYFTLCDDDKAWILTENGYNWLNGINQKSPF